jgi:hypothetical protein
MNYTLVDIGIGSSYDFFFEIAWPNYRDFGRNPSPITAVNASWPFWHLHEWYFWERHPTASDTDRRKFVNQVLMNDCPELGWLRDIAEAGKHFRLSRKSPPVRVRAISTREFGGPIGSAPIGSTPIAGSMMELLIDVGGATHDLPRVIGAVFEYWLGKILPHHVEFRLAQGELPERSESMLDWCRERLGDEMVRKWRWTLLQGANAPHYVQRLAFLEADDADAFRRHFQLK